MKTVNVRRAAVVAAALPANPVRPVGLSARPANTTSVSAAIERQIDEIQGTFGVRWEW